MARSEFHAAPKSGGRKSVLSGKDEIRGLPKSAQKSAPQRRRAAADCESVLSAPECIKGASGQKRRQ